MPTKIRQMTAAATCEQYTTTFDAISRNYPVVSMARFNVAVQPPAQVQASTWISSPVLLKQSIRNIDPAVYYFATAVLVDSQGNIADGSLDGTKAVNSAQLDASRSGSSATFVFSFANLAILHPGTYKIRFDIYAVSADNPGGATLVDELETRAIAVFESEVPRQRPSSDERTFIRKARDAGVNVSVT